MVHRDLLSQVITDLGGEPVMAEDSYDLSAYLERGDGGLDSDVNIAKLALQVTDRQFTPDFSPRLGPGLFL